MKKPALPSLSSHAIAGKALSMTRSTPRVRAAAMQYLSAIEPAETIAILKRATAFHVARVPALARVARADLVSLKYYTRGGFHEMNRALRRGAPMPPGLAALITCAASALQQMPLFQGSVRRGVNLSPAALAAYRPGAVVTEPAFVSAALHALTPEFELKRTRVFIKTANLGHDISSLSSVPEEREVLFAPGTSFRVLKVREVKDRVYSTAVYLEAVDALS